MKKYRVKLLLDIIMTICFICIMKIKITGMSMHEKLGILIFALVCMHLILNYKWIKAMTGRIFDKNLKPIMKISYALNMILCLLILLVIVSGMMISVTIFTQISWGNRALWANVHKIASLSAFICISIHVGMHWKYIMSGFKRMFKIENPNMIRTSILRLITAVIMVLGIVSLSNNSILRKALNINVQPVNNNNTKVQAAFEYVSIMGLFIGGTYYTLEKTNKKKI
ncbi:MAG: DUF4405 domain-containing protein [Clostridium sp.]|nr:DUF4405 domain-containing protein [Clostridium sp.]